MKNPPFIQPLTEQLVDYWFAFVKALPQIGVGAVVVIATWLIAKLASSAAHNLLRRARIRRALADLIATLLGLGVWVLGLLVAATIVFPSVTPAQIIGALGIGGIAVGLAFRDIFENFMAGAMIMLRKPMRIGDVIEVEGVEGKVEEITIRDTYLRRTDDQLVLMPNSMLFKNPVYIRTDYAIRRYSIIIGVGYDTDLDEARDIIRNAVEALDIVSGAKPVEVFAREFADSSITFTVRWWAEPAPRDMHASRDAVIRAVKTALDDAGIDIPFPQRTLWFPEGIKTELESQGASANEKSD